MLLKDLKAFEVARTIFRGRTVAIDGSMTADCVAKDLPSARDFNLDTSALDFSIEAQGSRARIIGVVEDQIVTENLEMQVPVKEGLVQPDLENDIIKLFVLERHHGTGNVGKGLVKGIGLKKGAIASSVAHDSHNLIIAGCDDNAMQHAAKAVAESGGGLCVADAGGVMAIIPLPVSGLMSDRGLVEVRKDTDRVIQAARSLGAIPRNPFMTLSFLALPVIPSLKLTDRGLVDVEKFSFVPLFC